MSVGVGRPLCLYGLRQRGKCGLGDFGDFELRLYIGKDRVIGEVGHPWNVSGGTIDVFLRKGGVRAGSGEVRTGYLYILSVE